MSDISCFLRRSLRSMQKTGARMCLTFCAVATDHWGTGITPDYVYHERTINAGVERTQSGRRMTRTAHCNFQQGADRLVRWLSRVVSDAQIEVLFRGENMKKKC